MLDATLRVRGCRGYVGDDGWVVGQKILPSPKREKRFKNAVIWKKKKSNSTRSHVNPTKSSGISLAHAQTLTLAGSASVSSRSHHSQMGTCPFLDTRKTRESGGSGHGRGGGGGRGVEEEKVEGYLHLA